MIKEVSTEIKLDNGKETITFTSINETRFGIFGEEVYSEFTYLDAQGKITLSAASTTPSTMLRDSPSRGLTLMTRTRRSSL